MYGDYIIYATHTFLRHLSISNRPGFPDPYQTRPNLGIPGRYSAKTGDSRIKFHSQSITAAKNIHGMFALRLFMEIATKWLN